MKSLALFCAFVAVSYAEITINDIDKLVNDIKLERVGLTDTEIKTAKDPFVYKGKASKRFLYSSKSDKKKRRYRFFLTAIINDSVKINNKWYRLNSKINGFKISKVGKDYALLTRKSEQIRLFLKRSKYKKIKLLVK